MAQFSVKIMRPTGSVLGENQHIVFVVNSLDSLIRLYSANLGWSREELGSAIYYPLHFTLQFLLVIAYVFTPFQIQWVGLVVVGIYAAAYLLMAQRMGQMGNRLG